MMDTIICPSCGAEIAVSETLATQIRQHLRLEFDLEARRRDRDIQNRLEEIRQKERELEASRESLEHQVSARIAQEQTRLMEAARVKVEQSSALEFQDLERQLADANNKIIEARKAELQLRSDRRDLEERQRELELMIARTLDAERTTIREQARQEVDEQHRLREADRDHLIKDLRAQIDDLKRRSEQGSPQARGEVMELELERLLRDQFPCDTIEPVPAGKHGGDVLQTVRDGSGLECGKILWESKRTKAWNDGWLPKLRHDRRTAKAQVAVLSTVEMPKGLATFGCIDGVWVTNRTCLIGLAATLRAGMIEAARIRRSLEGKQYKIDLLYAYLSGPEFRQKVDGIVEAFVTLKSDLESEKRSFHRQWKKREKQLERAVLHTAELYGDLGGIIGAGLPPIASLELPAPASEPSSDEELPAPASEPSSDEELPAAATLEGCPF
jgi:hypothetical protein